MRKADKNDYTWRGIDLTDSHPSSFHFKLNVFAKRNFSQIVFM